MNITEHSSRTQRREATEGRPEWRWSCACGKRSVWFPDKARMDKARATHDQKH